MFLGRGDKCWFTKGWFRFIVSKNRHLNSCSGDNTKHNYYGCTSVKSITPEIVSINACCFPSCSDSNRFCIKVIKDKKQQLPSRFLCLTQWRHGSIKYKTSCLFSVFQKQILDICIFVLIVSWRGSTEKTTAERPGTAAGTPIEFRLGLVGFPIILQLMLMLM